jgi:UDP-N-acetylmuramate: L-alanyl-gamma-D-glutamyl-meso-diaminopimelate ligase
MKNDSIDNRIKLPKRLHVIGICGVATSALAIAFHKRGVIVTGSDKGFFPPVSTELEQQGISYYAGWHPEQMFGGSDYEDSIIIVGTASGTTNPEILFAKEKGIPCFSYPEVIGKYFAKEHSIVCAGTWGKTSSSALLSFILEYADLSPTYMFGGISLSHDSAAKLTDSKWSVFEGDEYKSSPTDKRAKFFHYKTTELLLTAVSWDHADLYPTEQEYFDAFKKLVAGLPESGSIVACTDGAEVKSIIKDYKGKVIPYGRALPINETTPQYFAYKNLSQSKSGLKFTISKDNIDYIINSPILGLYQAENITGCFAMAVSIGIDPKIVVEAISKFKGLKRRMERRYEGNITIIDDIAHSPEKARSVINTLRSVYSGKVIVVFEPNSGGRSRESQAKYDNAFNEADTVIIPRLTKLKLAENADEQPMEGDELCSVISKTHNNAIHIDDDIKLVDFLKSSTKKDDVIAFLGSHGFRGMIEETIKKISDLQ